MADDARISTALPSHPKTRKLRKRVGVAGCWSLVCLFLWTANNRWDGNLSGMSGEDIELASEWEGEPDALVHALREVGFLDGDEGNYLIHDWSEHNPWAASRGQRIESAKRAAASRWASRGNAGRMQSACGADTEGMRESENRNAHHPTQPNPEPSSSEVSPSDQKIGPDSSSAVGEKKKPQLSHAAERLAALLKGEIMRNKPDFKITQAQLRNWAVTADRMMRLDSRKEESIAQLIEWAQRDEFWMSNILSMDKLREKFDQLAMKVGSLPSAKQPAPKRTWVEVPESAEEATA
jgi:hypothetical protein